MDPIRLIGIFREMEADGELTVRVYEQCLVEPEDFERLQAVRSDPADRESLFRTGPRKLLQDGSLGAKSAEMIDGYLDEPGQPRHPLSTPRKSCAAGFARPIPPTMDVAVHAIGDLAFRKVCDAIEWVEREEPWPDHRHGIVHAQTTTPALLERMKALGLQAYIQPIFIDADMNIIAERVGEAHAKECYNWKAMEDLGIRVSGGSDCPVEQPDVMAGIQCAVTRKTLRDHLGPYLPDQAMTVQEALDSFTGAGAYASFEEERKGRICPGMLADFVILGKNPFETPVEEIAGIAVLAAFVDGKCVYLRENRENRS